MYPLINSKHKFLLYWNARCACTSLKNWFYFLDRVDTGKSVIAVNGNGIVLPSKKVHMVVPYIEKPLRIRERYKDYTSILVTRNPVDRLVSVLNHPVLETMRITRFEKSKSERMDDLLDFLESIDLNVDVEHHLNMQCLYSDNHNYHKGPIRGMFDHILRIEDGPVIPRLNRILNVVVPDFRENISPKDSYVPTAAQVKRIKVLYGWDYFHFYPDDEGLIDKTYYDFYPQEEPVEYVPKHGDENTDILVMQNRMVALGSEVDCTGVFDDQTRDAIMKLQEEYGAEQTGEIDDATKLIIRGL